MSKTISATAMRDRLLARLQAPPPSDGWVRVLAVPGHRELLGLIARHNPPSIGALSELAGRAQPNVSRALNALIGADLIRVVSAGRRSMPQITEAGAAKAIELGLLEQPEEPVLFDVSAGELFSVQPSASAEEDTSSDVIHGRLTTWAWLVSSKERVAARTEDDLNALGLRLLEHWWRLLYRRDAPFRLWEFTLEDQPQSNYSLTATVLGAQINLHARGESGFKLDFEHGSRTFSVGSFEQHLLDEVMRPLAAHHWLKGRSARPLHGLLRKVEDSREQPAERDFCRTAGALGLSAYDLSDSRAAQIRSLLNLIPDEDARLEFGSAVLADFLDEGLHWTRQELDRFARRNAMPALMGLHEICTAPFRVPARPYRHGYALARAARARMDIAEDKSIGGLERLSKRLGSSDCIGLSLNAPKGLRAFQSFEGGVPTFILEDEGARPSVFTLARAVGDFIAFGSQASCVSNLRTGRQAVGRAFAAEFMAPRSAVVQMIEGEDQPVSRIADHFGVSEVVIYHQYENAF